MSIYRICLIGVVGLLGACAMPAVQPDAKPAAMSATPATLATPATVGPVAVNDKAPSMPMAPAQPQVPAPIETAPTEPAQAPMQMSAAPAKVVAAPEKPSASPQRAAHETVPVKKAVTTVAAAPAADAVHLRGRVTLSGARGQSIAASDMANTLVYFVPKEGAARIKPGHYTIYTHDHDFQPEAMAVPVGSTVTFVNLDDVRHNVFSATPAQAFDLGYQAAGEKVAHVFARAGTLQVNCKVHRSMQLSLLVVPSAYRSAVAANGSFTLAGVPAGPGTLYFWNPRAALASQSVTLPVSGELKQSLQISLPPVTTELNAQGSP